MKLIEKTIIRYTIIHSKQHMVSTNVEKASLTPHQSHGQEGRFNLGPLYRDSVASQPNAGLLLRLTVTNSQRKFWVLRERKLVVCDQKTR